MAQPTRKREYSTGARLCETACVVRIAGVRPRRHVTWGEMDASGHHEHRNVLVFEVDDESYGVDAERVQEIVRAVWPARLPAAPRVVRGVFNLRGSAVALIDLRARFGRQERELSPDEVFVVLRPLPASGRLLAFRADAARALRQVPPHSIVPIEHTAPRASYAVGTALLPDGVLLLCDVERFLDEAETLTLTRALDADETRDER